MVKSLLQIFWLMICLVSVFTLKQSVASQATSKPEQAPVFRTETRQIADFDLLMFDQKGKLKKSTLAETVGKDKVVVIDFWATWCGPCRQSIPDLVAAHNEYKDKGVEFVGFSVEDPDEANRTNPAQKNLAAVFSMAKDFKIAYRIGFSSVEMFSSFDRTGALPQTFVFDKKGNLVRQIRGFSPTRSPQLLRAGIDEALSS